jgi:CubicO group peptidase (beta-lactamase class C family)
MEDAQLFHELKGVAGIVQDGNVQVFSNEVSDECFDLFEIGSLTKTFTAALVQQEIDNSEISLNDRIDCFFNLPKIRIYPTIGELLTHHAGYKKDYFEIIPIVRCILGLDKSIVFPRWTIMKRIFLTGPGKKQYCYSNFGYAVLGLVLENIHSQSYPVILNEYLAKNGLLNTGINISDAPGFWRWSKRDAFTAAGGITSCLNDMLRYVKILMEDKSPNSELLLLKKTLDVSEENCVGLGMSWKIRSDSTAFHTGCTGRFNSYVSINTTTRTGIIVLLNSPYDKVFSAKDIGNSIETMNNR